MAMDDENKRNNRNNRERTPYNSRITPRERIRTTTRRSSASRQDRPDLKVVGSSSRGSGRRNAPHLRVVGSSAGGSSRTPSRGQSSNKGKNRQRQQRNILIICGLIFLLLLIGMIGFATRKNGREIFVDGESLGVINSSKVTKEDLEKTVTAQLEAERGSKVQLEDMLEVVPVHASKKSKNLVTVDYIIPKIREKMKYKVEAAVIQVDGSPVAILNNTEEANTLLDNILMEYIPEGSQIVKEESGFVQKVEVQNQYVNFEEIISSEQALEKLTAGTITTKPYTIALGDSLYKIAGNAGMTVEELMDVNPGMSITTNLIAGQQINITVSTPFLSVKTVETQTFTEKEPKKTEYRNDSTKSSSYRKVEQQGKDGQKEVTVQIIRINGFEEEQKVVDTKVIVEPITEIIVVGTK